MSNGRDDVAIVGVGCRLPPRVCGPEEFWSFLAAGGDAVREIPPDRWRWESFYDSDSAKPGKMNVRRGAFVDQRIEDFDAAFFSVPPREAAQLDPQQRLLLEVSWEAFEDAGLDVWALRGSLTGVFVGAFMLDNLVERAEPAARDHIGPQTAMTCTNTVLASRLSYFYDLRGPSLVSDTACSSSLVAVHQAVRGLVGGECDLAVAGGVNRIFRPEASLMMSKGQFLAADGRSKSFSANADGYGRGEGCGLVVLKRLADAERDEDRVYAVIEGTGVNQDGRTGGPAVPSAAAQAELISAVVDRAEVDPAEVVFVEAHGTGTPVGDPAEMGALGAVIGQAPGRSGPCVVGSVKAGIGHLEGAAGVVGLIKAALVAQRGVVPPQAWLDEQNPGIDFANLGLRVAAELVPLVPTNDPCRVAVNSFGYGGTNAHAVLREPPQPVQREQGAVTPGSDALMEFFGPVAVVSAHSEQAVTAMAASYAEVLGEAGSVVDRWDMLARFSARTAHEHRRVVLGEDAAFAGVLAQIATGDQDPDVISDRAPVGREVAPVFVYSGMGPQWWAMGRALLECHPGYRAHIQRCDAVFAGLAGWSLLDALSAPQDQSTMMRTAVAQPCSFALQTGVTAVLAQLGITPGAIVGHSVGEVAAAYTAGVLSLEDALAVAYHRSRLQATTAGVGGMLSMELSESDARDLIAIHEPAVSVAAVNAQDATTVAGDVGVLEAIEQDLTARDVFCRLLPVEVAYHSPAMDPILDELHASLSLITANASRLPLYSTVDPRHDGGGWDADYWAANTRKPVNFHATAERMVENGHRVFVEIGAHPVLSLYLQQVLGSARGGKVIPTLHRRRPDNRALLECTARLWAIGANVDWGTLLGRRAARGLPLYPWQRTEHWHEPSQVRRARTGELSGDRVMDGQAVSTLPSVRDVELSPTTMPWSRQHLVDGTAVFPATGFLEAVVNQARDLAGGTLPIAVEDLAIQRPLVLPDHQDPILRIATDPAGDKVTLAAQVRIDTEAWSEHATARIGRGRYSPPPAPPLTGSGTELVDQELDLDELYGALAAAGLDYKGPFRAVRHIRCSHARDRVEVTLDSPKKPVGGYTTYPPLVDAALHGVLAAHGLTTGDLLVPVTIRRAVIYGEVTSRCIALATITLQPAGAVSVDLTIREPSGRCLAELKGIDLRTVARPDRAQDWLDQCSYEPRWEHTTHQTHVAEPLKHLVIVAATPAIAGTLQAVATSGTKVTVLSDVAGLETVDLAAVDRVVISLCAGDTEPGTSNLNTATSLVRHATECASSDRPIEITFLTHGACAVLPQDTAGRWSTAWVTGLRRVAENELTACRLGHIDYDGSDDQALVALLLGPRFDEAALRHGNLYQPTLTALREMEHTDSWWDIAPTRAASEVQNFSLARPTPTLDGLAWTATSRRPPGPGEIELRIEAVGLNYKDILKQLGALDEEELEHTFVGAGLGMEAVVVAERVGNGVTTCETGGRYLAALAGGAFKRHVTLRATDARLIGDLAAWSDPQHAAALVAFGTAHRALAEVGNVQPGDTVLLHGATGAFGHAAIQVAHARGGRVLATASTPEKRTLLHELGAEATFDSRTLNFVDEVLHHTDGRGIDVIVNTLPGDGLRANLHAAAEGGRVIDISKREILDNQPLPLGLLDRNLVLASVDLDQLANEHDRFLTLGHQVMNHIRARDYQPIPVTVFPAAEINDAFALQARAEHVGKVVIDMRNTTDLHCREPAQPAGPIRPDRTYLITGGTGGLGIQLAAWLADRGARHLALISRRGHLNQTATQQVTQLRANGTQVTIAGVDVTDRDALGNLLDKIRAGGPPLAGIIHAAGVSHDKPLTNLDSADIDTVHRPKVSGAELLHELTLDDPLDLFILTSSVSTLTGTSGQAAYAAANTTMEALAHWRRRQGRPASAVALGPIADVGMAATTDEIARYVELLGFTPLPTSGLPAIFDRVLKWNRPVLGIFDLDWRTWTHAEPRSAASTRFTKILTNRQHSDDNPDTAWARIGHLTDNVRIEAIATHVTSTLTSVLGLEDQKVDNETSLSSLGLDSLMFLEIQTRLNRVLGAELSLMHLANMTTISEIAHAIDSALISEPPSHSESRGTPRLSAG